MHTKQLSPWQWPGWGGGLHPLRAWSLLAHPGILLRKSRGRRGWIGVWGGSLEPIASLAKEGWSPSPNLPSSPDPSQRSTSHPILLHGPSPANHFQSQLHFLGKSEWILSAITLKQEQAALPRVSNSKEFFFFKKTKKGKTSSNRSEIQSFFCGDHGKNSTLLRRVRLCFVISRFCCAHHSSDSSLTWQLLDELLFLGYKPTVSLLKNLNLGKAPTKSKQL